MKLLRTLLLILPLFMISCGGDDPLSENIIGTWNLISVQSTGCDDPDNNLEFTEPDDNGCFTFQNDVLCNIFITFSADGNAVETLTDDGGVDTEEYTFTTNDENNTAQFCEDSEDCVTLTFDGDELTRTVIDSGCTTVAKYEKQ